jgi:hypothetical protein
MVRLSVSTHRQVVPDILDMSPEAGPSRQDGITTGEQQGTYVKVPQPGPQQASKPHLVARLDASTGRFNMQPENNKKLL